MSSRDLISYNQSSSTTATLKDRETQTSRIYDFSNSSISNPSRPLPQNIENTAPPKNDKGKVFEFCEIIQDPSDPDSVSIIRERFSEEIITTTPKGSFFEKPTANKYKYCREVIQPYSKSFCTACPSNVPPRKKENSDCQPCPTNPPSLTCRPRSPSQPCEPSQNNQPSQSTQPTDPTQLCQPRQTAEASPPDNDCNNKSIKDRIQACVSAMDTNDKCKMHCKTTFINPKESKDSATCRSPCPDPCKTPCKKPCEEKSSQINLNCDKPKKPPCEKCDKVDEKQLKCCISKCIKDSVKAVKKGSAICINEIEKAIGIKHAESCEEKPTYYVLEKPRCPSYTGSHESSGLPKKSSVQEFFDSQTQTVNTIQCALKDFMGTVCSKTKDAIEVLKTESCKQIKPVSEKGKDGNTKDCSYVKSLSSITEKIKAQIDKIDISTDSASLEKILEPAKEVMDKVASVVSSTVSFIQEADFEKIANDVLEAKFNQSSPYDKPGGHKSPQQVAQEHEPSRSANMFTTIKTKLFSIFGQKDSCEMNDDDDDELSAEKYFDKYCDQ